MNQYKLAGGDGACYGPRFGPVFAEEANEISDKYGKRYLLLELVEPLMYENDRIEFLLISPRYTGDTVKSIRTGECTIGVWRVLPGKQDNLVNGLSESNAEYWSIGTSCKVTT